MQERIHLDIPGSFTRQIGIAPPEQARRGHATGEQRAAGNPYPEKGDWEKEKAAAPLRKQDPNEAPRGDAQAKNAARPAGTPLYGGGRAIRPHRADCRIPAGWHSQCTEWHGTGPPSRPTVDWIAGIYTAQQFRAHQAMLAFARLVARMWEMGDPPLLIPEGTRRLQRRGSFADMWDTESPPWEAWASHVFNEARAQLAMAGSNVPD